MHATVLSGAVLGVDALMVDVEVDISSGLPQMAVVGLPDKRREGESRSRTGCAEELGL